MSMSDQAAAERFMRRAIELSRLGIESGAGGPFGCVIVRDGQIVGEGHNRVLADKDPTAHGEMVAIRDACRRLADFRLSGCELYTTGEPCPMCFSAIYWSRIARVYYGFTVADAASIRFDDVDIAQQLFLPPSERRIPQSQLLVNEALTVLRQFAANPNRPIY
jgi:tRNA(Arg) A34 adenosine deaminase TadA